MICWCLGVLMCLNILTVMWTTMVFHYCLFSCPKCEPHTCGLKTFISCLTMPKQQFLALSWGKFWGTVSLAKRATFKKTALRVLYAADCTFLIFNSFHHWLWWHGFLNGWIIFDWGLRCFSSWRWLLPVAYHDEKVRNLLTRWIILHLRICWVFFSIPCFLRM